MKRSTIAYFCLYLLIALVGFALVGFALVNVANKDIAFFACISMAVGMLAFCVGCLFASEECAQLCNERESKKLAKYKSRF